MIVPLSAMVPGEGLAMQVNDSESRFLFVGPPLNRVIAPHKDRLTGILKGGLLSVGFEAEGWTPYEQVVRESSTKEPPVRLTLEDDFNIIYSSGTTGVPKGIIHTHYARQQFAFGAAIMFRINQHSVSILTTPLFANGTWVTMLPTMLTGGTMVIMPTFDPRRFLELVEREKGTHAFMVPTQFVVTLGLPDFDRFDLSSLQFLLCGGAPLRRDTKEEIIRRFGCGLVEFYGTTEGVAIALQPEDAIRKVGSVGKPFLGNDIRIVDDQGRELPQGEIGEIVGFSSVVMRGYHNQPEKTAEAIWRDERGRTYLRTGDVGRLDEDGYLYILDRKKDMIISGGINIFASDIEGVLAKHPAVQDVAVIGIPHEKWGETPLALVVRRAEATATGEEIMEWANAQLAKYQRISGVEFRDSLPRNPLGKLLKRELREPYWGKDK